MNVSDLYDTDFVAWTEQNAELLRSGRAAEADLERIAAQLEGFVKSDRRALHRRLAHVIERLLKCRSRPSVIRRKRILEERIEIGRLLKYSPSLKANLAEVVQRAYWRAVKAVATDKRFSGQKFPAKCPYTVEQLLDHDFLPTPE